MIHCLRFFIEYPDFQENQTYQLSHIYNQNDDRIYNKMYTSNWWYKEKKLPARARIIPIFLTNEKTVMSLSYGDKVLWPVYITIGNLDAKMCWSQNRLRTLHMALISIVYERAEDSNNKDRNLKAKTYSLTLITILKHI